MTSTLRRLGAGGVDKNKMLLDIWGWGWVVRECYGRPILVFLLKKLGFTMTKHHAQPSINILLTRNLHFYSDVRQ